MTIDFVTVILLSVGCISIIYYGLNNIKEIRNRNIPKKDLRKERRRRKAKEKYGKDYIKN